MTLERFRLDGRTAFVSGAAGHLGRAMCVALADAGAKLIINGRNPERLGEFARELASGGNSVECAPFDVSEFDRVRDFFARLPRLDVVVNNAVTMTPASLAEIQPHAFDAAYRSSVTAAFEIFRAALPALRKAVAVTGDASVINIASMYGLVAPDRRIYTNPDQASPAHYGPAKAALIQLTRHLAAEFGKEAIRVNALVPGPFPRPQVLEQDMGFGERLAAKTMLGRTGEAHEIGGPLLFLASSASRFVTGSAVTVDGGWTAW